MRLQPASQSAGYEEEQSNPPNLGLAVSVTVIAAHLGASGLGTKLCEVKLGVAKDGSGRLKCWGKGNRRGLGTSNTVCLLKFRFNSNEAQYATKLTCLPPSRTLLSDVSL